MKIWQAFMELLNRAPSPEILQQVDDVLRKCTAVLPVQALFVRVIQPGRTRMVPAHVVLPAEFQVDGLPMLDAVRAETLEKLKAAHLATVLDMVFTADPGWGAPAGQSTKA